jgi:DNA-binding NtrC family response regulator
LEGSHVESHEKRDVLILDEETDTLMNLFDRVYGEGFDTTGVSTEREALSLVARRKPYLMIDHLHGADAHDMQLIEKVHTLSPRTHILVLGEEDARPPGFDRVRKAEEVDWVPEDPEESALVEALKHATADLP